MSVADIKAILSDTTLTEDARAIKAQALLDKISAQAAEKAEDKATSGSMMSMFTAQSPAAKDPVQVMREVFADDAFSAEEKNILFYMSRERFQNRRKMAYVALIVLVSTTVFLAIGWLVDATNHATALAACLAELENLPTAMTENSELMAAIAGTLENECTRFPFSEVLEKNTEILTWLGTFFTSIIALYYGAASFRPTS
jgi:hypothetical protein